jgi:hypothetical protein
MQPEARLIVSFEHEVCVPAETLTMQQGHRAVHDICVRPCLAVTQVQRLTHQDPSARGPTLKTLSPLHLQASHPPVRMAVLSEMSFMERLALCSRSTSSISRVQ